MHHVQDTYNTRYTGNHHKPPKTLEAISLSALALLFVPLYHLHVRLWGALYHLHVHVCLWGGRYTTYMYVSGGRYTTYMYVSGGRYTTYMYVSGGGGRYTTYMYMYVSGGRYTTQYMYVSGGQIDCICRMFIQYTRLNIDDQFLPSTMATSLFW